MSPSECNRKRPNNRFVVCIECPTGFGESVKLTPFMCDGPAIHFGMLLETYKYHWPVHPSTMFKLTPTSNDNISNSCLLLLGKNLKIVTRGVCGKCILAYDSCHSWFGGGGVVCVFNNAFLNAANNIAIIVM
uniref:Uncharacterized protein n=1 Tax=Glossina pallidipes TaxID=7398 RepID=A0A1B0AJK9_GLOPL